ncbi:phasin family protein [Palleronia sp.]|uniref:phasin family protein n=1 Tax=Palleronia sp. TaxID=1940284 RepID=UPI0035C8670C
MATKTNTDYSKMMQEMMSSMPTDMSAYQNAFKSYASFGERMSKVVIEAAGKSTEISSKWTQDTLKRMNDATVVRDEPADYGKAMTDFASAQAETTAETMAKFAEIAKSVQMETVELMLSAGKDVSGDLANAAKKATGVATSAAK